MEGLQLNAFRSTNWDQTVTSFQESPDGHPLLNLCVDSPEVKSPRMTQQHWFCQLRANLWERIDHIHN